MNNILNQFNEKVSNLVKIYVENLIFSKGISSFTDDLVAEFAHFGSDLTQFIIEYAIISNSARYLYDDTVSSNSILNIFDFELIPRYNKTIEGSLCISENASNIGFFVVPDKVVANQTYTHHYMIGNYINKDKEKQQMLNQKIFNFEYNTSTSFTNKIEICDNSIGISVLATFIGLYIGIIFLISSAAILALKDLSDSLDDKDKYKILRNIGTDEKTINKSIFKQTLIFFLLPLSLAFVHTIFGIKSCLILLESIGIQNLSKAIITTGIILTLIYGGYFIITYLCNKNIIKEKN